MNHIIYTDGGSINNPGQAAYAFLIYKNGKLLYKQSERIGIASNNVAEYTALIRALEYINNQVKSQKSKVKNLLIISDSQLMVNQLIGLYKVKNVDIKPLHSKIKFLEMMLGIPIYYKHVLRDKNKEADSLVKEALERA